MPDAKEVKAAEAKAPSARKDRSPNYPSLAFRDALDRTKRVFEAEKKHPVNVDIAVKHMGLAYNGRTRMMVAAMKQYGLLVTVGNQVRVTDDAASVIVLPEDDPKRDQIIRRLAMQPRVFQQIIAKFGATLPSDANLAAYLQLELDFTKEACPTLIKVLRHAIDVAGVDGVIESAEIGASVSTLEAPMTPTASQAAPPQATVNPPLATPRTQQVGLQHRSWNLGDGVEMPVAIPARLTKKNLDKLRKYVEVLASEAAIAWEDGGDA